MSASTKEINVVPVTRYRETLVDDWLTLSVRPAPSDPTHKLLVLTNHSAVYRANVAYVFDDAIPIVSYGDAKKTHRNSPTSGMKEVVVQCFVDPYEQVTFLSGPFVEFVSKSISAGPPDRAFFLKQADECQTCIDDEMAELKMALRRAEVTPTSSDTVSNRKWTPELIAQLIHRERCCGTSATATLRFIDVSFPPKAASLHRPGLDGNPLAPSSANPIVFQRPDDVLRGTAKLRASLPQASLFGTAPHTIAPDQVRQGILGDCYLCCAMACCATIPVLVRDLFSPLQDPDSGALRVMLCKYGWWQTVLIDDFLPTQSGRLCFTRSLTDSTKLWPSYLEKAMAKCYGSFAAIRSGDAPLAMMDFSGCPYIRLKPFFAKSSTINKRGTEGGGGPVKGGMIRVRSNSFGGNGSGVPLGSFAALIHQGGSPTSSNESATSSTDESDRLFYVLLEAIGRHDGESMADSTSSNSTTVPNKQQRFMATLATPSKSTMDASQFATLSATYDEVGLTLDHAYSVMRVVEIPAVAASSSAATVKPLRLIELRDPWGGGGGKEPKVWKGAFGPKDTTGSWTPALRQHIGDIEPSSVPNTADSGVDARFWMPWSEAFRWFDSGALCRVIRHWPQLRIQSEILGETGVVTRCLKLKTNIRRSETSVDQRGNDARTTTMTNNTAHASGTAGGDDANGCCSCYFGLHQKDRRAISSHSSSGVGGKPPTQPPYSGVLLSALLVDERNHAVVSVVAESDPGGVFQCQRDVFLEADLPPLPDEHHSYFIVAQCLADATAASTGRVAIPVILSASIENPAQSLDGDVFILESCGGGSSAPSKTPVSAPYCPSSKFRAGDYQVARDPHLIAWQVRLTHPDAEGLVVTCRTGSVVSTGRYLTHHLYTPPNHHHLGTNSGSDTPAAGFHAPHAKATALPALGASPLTNSTGEAADMERCRAASHYDPITPTSAVAPGVLPIMPATSASQLHVLLIHSRVVLPTTLSASLPIEMSLAVASRMVHYTTRWVAVDIEQHLPPPSSSSHSPLLTSSNVTELRSVFCEATTVVLDPSQAPEVTVVLTVRHIPLSSSQTSTVPPLLASFEGSVTPLKAVCDLRQGGSGRMMTLRLHPTMEARENQKSLTAEVDLGVSWI